MASDDKFSSWIVHDTNWSRAALPTAAILTLISPLLRRELGAGPFSVFVQLPVYMVHQYEEHGHGAFKSYGNHVLQRRHGRLTDGNIFFINIVGVWGMDLAALHLSRHQRQAAGLLAPYLSIVNSLVHLVAALRSGRYNPGAWTAGLLLLPAGIYSAAAITHDAPIRARDHARAFGGAVLLHLVAILIILGTRPAPRGQESQ